MKMHIYFKLAIVILLIQLVAVLILGYSLPKETKLPTHWNIKSEIDGYASRDTAIIPFWLFNLGLFLLMMFSRKISPVYRQNQERYDAVIPIMSLGLVFFFALFHVYILLLGHYPEWQGKTLMIYVLIGALFVFLGNILPKVPRNFIAGIRVPWTLYSDEIWRKTSRLGGYCFVILGLVMIIRGIFNLNTGWMNALSFILLLIVIFVPVIFAFILYKTNKKEE